jgi:hypothetical protein
MGEQTGVDRSIDGLDELRERVGKRIPQSMIRVCQGRIVGYCWSTEPVSATFVDALSVAQIEG